MSPFYANTGVHPMGLTDICTSSANLTAEDFAKHVKDVHALAQANLTKAAADMKQFYDWHAGQQIEFEPGAKVFLDGHHIQTDRPSAKMEDKWFGPYEVVERVGAGAYRLKLPSTWKKVHPVFNVVLLKPANKPAFESQQAPLPPPLVVLDNEEEYEVDGILDSYAAVHFEIAVPNYHEIFEETHTPNPSPIQPTIGLPTPPVSNIQQQQPQSTPLPNTPSTSTTSSHIPLSPQPAPTPLVNMSTPAPIGEAHISKPNNFDGNKGYAHHFLSSCEAYLSLNEQVLGQHYTLYKRTGSNK
ncbi:hypothetical protein EW145_g6289 [Phellinidium pouzarii]|uniref:Tf2-1-like SH3-like domain-containing protein n=1 Tax=Phellinidium pouzarii TaxID=167371 RepID=A0A4S4KX10_9AGAM|nr:hypothetical protein EW145_g6289 [Phellinidium pouzarii]